MAATVDPLFVQEEIPIQDGLTHKFGIESVIGQSFEIKNDVRSSDGFKSYLLVYDRFGNRRRQEKYSRDGNVICEWIYDEKGKLLREIDRRDSGEINYRIEVIYSHDCYWKQKNFYLSGDSIHCRIVAKRDAGGRFIEGIYYDAADHRIRTDSYSYDDRGRLEMVSMGHMGEWTYEYDENDNLKRKTGHLPSGSVLGETFEFQYDARGLLRQRNHLHYSSTEFDSTFF